MTIAERNMKSPTHTLAATFMFVLLIASRGVAEQSSQAERLSRLEEQVSKLMQVIVALDDRVKEPGPSPAPSDLVGGQKTIASNTSAPQGVRQWTNVEVWLSIGVLIFGALVLLLQSQLIYKAHPPWSSNAILRINGLTLIITGALMLVTASYSANDIAPVIGLLGSIAGYLLGSGSSSQHRQSNQTLLPTESTQ